jgi:hypothetical protein
MMMMNFGTNANTYSGPRPSANTTPDSCTSNFPVFTRPGKNASAKGSMRPWKTSERFQQLILLQ